MDRVVGAVNCLRTLQEATRTFEEEKFDPIEDSSTYVELFSEDIPKIIETYKFLKGELVFKNPSPTPVSVKEEDEEKEVQTSSKKKRTLNKMTKVDAESASLYIAKKCRGRADLFIVAKEAAEYMNNRFNPKTLYSLIIGRSHKTESQKYFKVEKGKIRAL